MQCEEEFQCLSCYHKGPLNLHLRCAVCDSDFVKTVEMVGGRQFGRDEICAFFGIPSHLVGHA